jgi:CTP synthase
MRLGQWVCCLAPGSKAEAAYGQSIVFERHRHRYEFNNAYRKRMEANGMLLSGRSADGSLIEIIELKDHPWFVGTQFHPEFKSRPTRPHPLFRDFIAAARKRAGVDTERSAEHALQAAQHAAASVNGHYADDEDAVAGAIAGQN